MGFEKHFNSAWQTLALTGLPPVASLRDAYTAPTRFYHTLEHIETCLALMEQLEVSDPRLALAICYHDVVYDTHTADSEELSAAWAHRDLTHAQAHPADVETVTRLILITTHRTKPEREDEKILVDIDLSILGTTATLYEQYVRSIRREYGWVAEKDFRAGRAKFLRGMLSRDFIYSTPRLRAKCETAARENLRQELNRIEPANPARGTALD